MDIRQFFTNQTWWGKCIGAFFGFLMAGPAGALFGLLIGNFFDRGLNQHFNKPCWAYRVENSKAVQLLFIKTLFAVMGHIAKADGRVSEQAIQMANTYMHSLGLNKHEKNVAQQAFQEGKNKNFDLKTTLSRFYEVMRYKNELLRLFINIQYKAAHLEGLSSEKLKIINTTLQWLHFATLHQQDPFTRYQRSSQQSSSYNHRTQTHSGTSLEQAFHILGITQTANKQDVKRAYRRMMSQYHPDKLIAKGVPEHQMKAANAKAQAISKAYEDICRSKGW